MKGKFAFMFLATTLILCLGIVSADTFFKGQVREDNPLDGSLVENATVTVICNGSIGTGFTNTFGVYGISFSETECNSSHTYVISATEGNRRDRKSVV